MKTRMTLDSLYVAPSLRLLAALLLLPALGLGCGEGMLAPDEESGATEDSLQINPIDSENWATPHRPAAGRDLPARRELHQAAGGKPGDHHRRFVSEYRSSQEARARRPSGDSRPRRLRCDAHQRAIAHCDAAGGAREVPGRVTPECRADRFRLDADAPECGMPVRALDLCSSAAGAGPVF